MKRYRLLCPLALLAIVPLVACADLSEPWQLNYTRVLAVRATPPGLAPSETTTFTALVFDGSAVREIAVTNISVPAPFAAVLTPAAVPAFWQAADRNVLANELATRQIPDGEALVVPVSTSLTLAGVDNAFLGLKYVRVGNAAANPEEPIILIDGVALRELTLHAQQVATFAVANSAPALTYTWATTHGELQHAAAANSELTATELGDGVLVVVVRDGVGGVSWAQLPLHVVP
jgi:hypothetical protein